MKRRQKRDTSYFFAAKECERDAGFREEILQISRRGLVVAAGLGAVSALMYLAWYLIDPEPITWTYANPGARSLWEELLILALSIVGVVLSRTKRGPEWGRLTVSVLVLVICAAMLIEDIAHRDAAPSVAYIGLAMIIAIGTMPYRPAQSLALGIAVTGLYTLFIYYLPWRMDVEVAGRSENQFIYLFVMTSIMSGISALIYKSRYEQYRAYRELERTQAQLIQAEKMASLGHLTAGIAHEIMNPLNFINNFAEINVELTREVAESLAESPPADPENLQGLISYLQINSLKIGEQGKRADAIVRSMMLHARSSSGERRLVNLNGLVDEYVNLVHSGLLSGVPNASIEIERDYDETVGEIEVVPQDLSRVLVNLLTNAFDAVLEKKETNGQFAPVVSIGTRRLPDGVEIRIRDNGSGIPSALLTKIFEPFFTTKPAGKGTGLGLSISYDIIVNGQGGKLLVENDEGHGAAFVIRLPSAVPRSTFHVPGA